MSVDLSLTFIQTALPTETRGVNNLFELHRPKALRRCFRKSYGHVFRLHYSGTCDSGRPGLSKEACLHAGAGWLTAHLSVRGGEIERAPLAPTIDFIFK